MNEAQMTTNVTNYLRAEQQAKTDPLMVSYVVGLWRGLTDAEKEVVRATRR